MVCLWWLKAAASGCTSDCSCLPPAPAPASGQVVTKPSGLRAIIAFFQALLAAVVFFFRTIFNPTAADEYAAKQRRGGGGGYGGGGRPGGGGGGGGGPRGPRITGLADLRDASGGAACGAGG